MKGNMLFAWLGLVLAGVIFIYSFYSALSPYDISEFAVLIASIILLASSLAGYWFSKRQRKRLLELEHRFSDIRTNLVEYINKSDNLFNYSNVGIFEIELDGRFIQANLAFSELTGYDHGTLSTFNFFEMVEDHDLSHLQQKLQDLINSNIQFFQAELQCFRRTNESLWLVANFSMVRDINDNAISLLGQVQNITLQKKAEDRLKHMAYHDFLTGLPNRNKLEQFLDHILASSRRHHRKFAMMFLDLDHFKNINDTIGHDAGDTLLQIISERLLSLVRTTDIVARLGGDEFVLVVTDINKMESVALIAQKLMDAIRQPIVIKGKEIYATCSIGISIYPEDGKNTQMMMKNADLALYRAKEQGRNNFQFYTDEMTRKASTKMDLQNALAHALAKSEFYLEYQPVLDIKTRSIISIEALLRWNNKDYGLITPNKIIEVSEECGLIIPVSQWVMQTACQQLKQWHNMGYSALVMSVNCSARQFQQSNLIDEIILYSKKTGITPDSLAIELTESTIMKDSKNILRMLYHLKDLGCKIYIDDFGTGYWSLSHIRHIKVDKIKIDKSFTSNIPDDELSREITCAVLAMAKHLNIIAIAEGVENHAQYQFLENAGCQEIQGYYLTQPLTADKMTQFLKHPVPDAEKINQEGSLT